MKINNCKLVNLSCFSDNRGKLIFVEGNELIPFEIKRIFYMLNHPPNTFRGGHAHINAQQFIIPISGSFIVKLFDGEDTIKYNLCEPNIGLYIPKMIWVDIMDLGPNDICLVLTSEKYSEEDYIRNINVFLERLK